MFHEQQSGHNVRAHLPRRERGPECGLGRLRPLPYTVFQVYTYTGTHRAMFYKRHLVPRDKAGRLGVWWVHPTW